MITTTLIYDHRNPKDDKEHPIEVRVTIKRKSIYVNTGIRVMRQHFAGGTITGRHDAAQLNERLVIIYSRIQAEINRYVDEGLPVDVAAVRRKAWQEAAEADPDASPMLDWFEEQIEMLNLAEGTMKHYKTFVGRLREWGKMRRWKDLTTENIYAFDSWLHKLRRPVSKNAVDEQPQLVSDATVYTYHKCMKAMLNRALQFEKIDKNPYDRLKGKFKRGEHENVEYLTEEEMRLFCETKPPVGTQMDVAHDLFIFQMYTGLSYSDTQAFVMSDYRMVDGRYVNTGERVKTGVPYVSQLLPPAVAVLEKYGWTTPKIGNAEYNLCLKALGMVAGIKTTLHSHLARHTFATYMLRNGAKIQNVSAMLGHTNIRQTQRYAKVLAQSVHDDFDMISQKIKKEKI